MSQTLEDGVSFRDKLISKRDSHMPSQSAVEIEFQHHDVKIGTENDMPTIKFSERVKEILARSMECSIVVKLLGRNVDYKLLFNRLMALWKPSGEIRITDLDNGYFLVNMDNYEDCVNALTKGPWTILGHYLTVELWSINFNPEANFPASTVIWIRLPNMLVHYYHKSTLRAIASIIGELIKVDYMTESRQRGKFACMVVKVNLNKPLISRFKIDDRIQTVEYEDLPIICYGCGHFGHVLEHCNFRREEQEGDGGSAHRSKEDTEKVDNFPVMGQHHGPWMHIQKRGRRSTGNEGMAGVKSGGKSGARFDILADLEEDLDGIGNPVFSGLEGKQGVVDGAGKDSSIDKETVDRKFQGQAAVQGKNRGIDLTREDQRCHLEA